MDRTNLEDILVTKSSSVIRDWNSYDVYDLIDEFHDTSNPIGERKVIYEIMKSKDPELAKEQIINLCRNYEGSGSKALLSFIYFVLDYFNLDLFSKIECVFTIYNSNIKFYLDLLIFLMKNDHLSQYILIC
jgi:hypothetical protein